MRHAQILVQEGTTVLAMKDTWETGKRAKVLSLNINCLVYLNFPSELPVGECYVYFTLIAENNLRIIREVDLTTTTTTATFCLFVGRGRDESFIKFRFWLPFWLLDLSQNQDGGFEKIRKRTTVISRRWRRVKWTFTVHCIETCCNFL